MLFKELLDKNFILTTSITRSKTGNCWLVALQCCLLTPLRAFVIFGILHVFFS